MNMTCGDNKECTGQEQSTYALSRKDQVPCRIEHPLLTDV